MKYLMGRILTSLALAVLLLAGVARAQYAERVIKVNIPFEFAVGEATFPAGEYSVVRSDTHLLLLRDSERRILTTILTRSVQGTAAPAKAKLEFDVEDGLHVLTQVWQEGNVYGHELYRSKSATALAKRRSRVTQAAAGSQP